MFGALPQRWHSPSLVGLVRFAVECPCWHRGQLLGWSHGDCAQRTQGSAAQASRALWGQACGHRGLDFLLL